MVYHHLDSTVRHYALDPKTRKTTHQKSQSVDIAKKFPPLYFRIWDEKILGNFENSEGFFLYKIIKIALEMTSKPQNFLALRAANAKTFKYGLYTWYKGLYIRKIHRARRARENFGDLGSRKNISPPCILGFSKQGGEIFLVTPLIIRFHWIAS